MLQPLAVIVGACLLWLHLVGGNRLIMNSTVECRTCNDSSQCRDKDCRIPLGTEITVTCVYTNARGHCPPHENVLGFHRVDSEGSRLIRGIKTLPGFKAESSKDGCVHRLTFISVPDTDIILQCVRTNHNHTNKTHSNTLVFEALQITSTPTGTRTPAETSTPTPTGTNTPTETSALTSHGSILDARRTSVFCVIVTLSSVLYRV